MDKASIEHKTILQTDLMRLKTTQRKLERQVRDLKQQQQQHDLQAASHMLQHAPGEGRLGCHVRQVENLSPDKTAESSYVHTYDHSCAQTRLLREQAKLALACLPLKKMAPIAIATHGLRVSLSLPLSCVRDVGSPMERYT